MQIIVVSDRLATAKTLTFTRRHVAAAFLVSLLLVVALAAAISYLALRHAADLRLPVVHELVLSVQQQEMRRTEDFVRENIGAIAAKVGQMQAQVLRLDSLGERLSRIAGIKPSDLPPTGSAGQGGPLVQPTRALTAEELGQEVDAMLDRVDRKIDLLTAVETTFLDQRVVRNRLPTASPVATQSNASGFGWRIDPFTGERARHEGVDFQADVGEPIVAAAMGIVIAAEKHPDYGNLVEVDHGNGYTTRYAHASKIVVVPGQVVRRGQKLAEVGSTGRSTGPHLHFEVRYHGVAQNPTRFLKSAEKLALR